MISVIVPALDEEPVLPALCERLRAAMECTGDPYEVIFVDDGSADGTVAVVAGQQQSWPQARLVRLARHSGHQAALTAGLEEARGSWVVTMDADLQDPPELIPEMLRTAGSEGVDVVYACRDDRSTDGYLKRAGADAYYRIIRRFSAVRAESQVADFRLMSRRVVDSLLELPERHRVYRLLVPWLGYPSRTVYYRRPVRAAGKSKYSLSRMVWLGTTSLISFTAAPLRLATAMGLLSTLTALLLVMVATVAWAVGSTVRGWTSTTLAVLFLGGVQLFCVGVLGEYVARIYDEVKRRPLYRVDLDAPPPSVKESGPPAIR